MDAAFAEFAADEVRQAQNIYDELQTLAEDEFGEGVLLPDGRPNRKRVIWQRPNPRALLNDYDVAYQKICAMCDIEDRKPKVFNHLYAFFNRYNEDGDFIPKRRYGSKETYTVPYNGEEAFFYYWANRAQHYVKTAERLRDYTFKVRNLTGEYRVRVTTAAVSIPKDNNQRQDALLLPPRRLGRVGVRNAHLRTAA